MLRARVSRIETFRRVLETSYADESSLIRDIQGNPDPPNWMMAAGTAWHKALECKSVDSELLEVNGWEFRREDWALGREVMGHGLQEITGRRVYGSLEVQGTCDHLRGLVIQDHKTKFSIPDAKAYEASLQWRFYLSIFGADCFRYNLFHFTEDNHRCELRDVVSVRFWRYPGMEEELIGWANLFALWVQDKGLAGYLKQAA